MPKSQSDPEARRLLEQAVATVLPGRYPDPDDAALLHPTAPTLFNCKGLKRVADALVSTNTRHPLDTLVKILWFLHFSEASGDSARHIIKKPVGWDKDIAIAKIRQAAEALTDPVLGRDYLNMARLLDLPVDHPERQNIDFYPPSRLDHPESVIWWADRGLLPELLLRLAKGLRKVSSEKITPPGIRGLQWYERQFNINYSNVGRRGAASNPIRAQRGFMVKQLYDLIPSNTVRPYGAIADLMGLVGYQISPNNVRGIILSGHT